MRHTVSVLLLAGALALSACGSQASAPATPESWTPPATATPAPTAMATPTRPAVPTYTVQRGTIEQRAELRGRVVGAGERELAFAVDGIVQNVYVTPDANVTRGQVLAELAPGELADRLARAQRQYDEAQQRMERAMGDLRFPLRRAEIDLESARAVLAQLLAPPDPARVTAARAAVVQAEAARDRARNDASAIKNRAELELKAAQERLSQAQAEFTAATQAVERDRNDNGAQERLARARDALRAAEADVARLQIDVDTARGNEIAAVQAAEAQLALAQLALDDLLKGPGPSAIAEARRAVARAELAVDESRNRIQVDPEISRLVTEAKQSVDEVQRQIDALKLIAGFDGRVAAVNVAPGSVIRTGEPAIIVTDPTVDPSLMQVLVPGGSAPALVAGQPVAITFARYPGATYNGIIAKTPADQQSASLALSGYHITFEPSDLKLESGDSAVVSVVLARREDALWLPPKAIRADSRSYVIIQRGDQPQRIDIETGLANENQVEIVSGLNEGDVVIGQ